MARQACEVVHPGVYFGLRCREPVSRQLPSLANRMSRERVIDDYVNYFIDQVSHTMHTYKAEGYYEQPLNNTTDPAKAGLVFKFKSPEQLYQVIRRLNRGALVTPVDDKILMTFCGGELYGSAAERGRKFDDLLFAVSVNFVDEESAEALHKALVYNMPGHCTCGGAAVGAPVGRG